METMAHKNTKKSFDFINEQVNKKSINKLLAQVYLEFGGAKTANLADNLKNLGYRYATKSGTTISIADLSVPADKKELLNDAEREIEKSTRRYLKGDITEVERYTKVIDTWSETTSKLTAKVVENFDRLNPVYMMAFSGARGNVSQVSQLVGMRGLMADAQGQIIDLPIKSNFKEGLSVTEYIISSYGARKGLVDTALKTADSGYLTRRLVDVAQDVIIRDHDCGTHHGIVMTDISDGEKIVAPLTERLLGRTIAEDIKDENGNVVIPANTTIDRDDIRKIKPLNLHKLLVRSPLTCELEYGICQKCYGWAMTTQKLVDVGEAIGIIAAQSIGEPGTQLTMRTFHTGGVFKGAGAMKEIIADIDGVVANKVFTRDQRTRHGDNVAITLQESDLEIKGNRTKKYHIPSGAILFVHEGQEVKKGDKIAVYEPASGGDGSRLTEKATKDITSDLSGEIVFEDFIADEKKDRQGNISRTANKNGIVWVLGGDVYNLPGGSTILVEDGKTVKEGEKLAEIHVISEHGGEVRIGDNLKVEDVKFDGKKIKKIVQGKELTIVIASITAANASFEITKKEQLWTVDETGEKYIVKAPVDTMVESGMIIAELVDEEYTVPSSGEIRYNGIEVDENQIITKPGEVIFIPDEIHQVNKDSSLKMVESGTFVTAGTEVVKDLYAHIDGIVEIKEFNDMIHEVVIRPGAVYNLDSISELKVYEGEVVAAGTEIAPKITVEEDSIVTILDNEKDTIEEDIEDLEENMGVVALDEKSISNQPVQILVRPVQKFRIDTKDVSIKFNSTDEAIDLVPVTQLQYKDGARVRNFDGSVLTRTSLVLQMDGYLSHLKGQVELDENNNLKIVVLETLIVRREAENSTAASMQTELLVSEGQVIDPKTPVAKTQVLAINDAVASIKENNQDVRRLLLVSDNCETKVELKSKPIVKVGELVKMDGIISEGGETSELSGLVVDVNKNTVTFRVGRPYLISPGTMLQVANGSLVNRGDMIATLVFERQKTGDIVQGLPRVEELLEARKPKDSAVVAEYAGKAEIEIEDDVPRLFLNGDLGRQEVKYSIDSNLIVANGQNIAVGQPLTGGPLNPHDVIRLNGVEAAQQYLVDEVQRVYRSQGVEIADKHVEVIVRQMTKKVRIIESGDTKLLPGEFLEFKIVEQENAAVREAGGQEATYEAVLLGITKASLNTESFISAASFQETTRILTEAAVEGKRDLLRGLKENVIIGRLIPAGTGFYHLTNASEEKDRDAQKRAAEKNNARKPSAILEEIEGMFGAPELTDYTIE